MPKVSISDRLLDEAQKLIYRKWAEAYDSFKRVKAEKNDGSKDWHQFHDARMHNNGNELDRMKQLLDEINNIAPLTRK